MAQHWDTELLDRIFNTPDEQIETFADVILDRTGTEDLAKDEFAEKVVKGDPQQIEQVKMVEATNKFVRITSGFNQDDYILHVGPAHPKKPWKVTTDRVIFAAVHVWNKHIPREIVVDIFPPYSDWEIQEITFKAHGLKKEWSVDENDLKKLTLELFDVLGELIK